MFSAKRLLAVIKKEIIQIKRDPPSLVIAFVMPVMMLLLFGYAVNTDVDNIPTAVVDRAKTLQSRELIDNFENSGFFSIAAYPDSEKEVGSLIDSGKIKVGIIIPGDYSRNLKSGGGASVQVLIDGSDPMIARTALQSAQVIAQAKSLQLKAQTLTQSGLAVPAKLPLDIRPLVWYNPEMESVKFNIPGLIGIIMQNITVMLTAFALVRERERGTLEQLIITPLKSYELIVAKLIPYIVIAFIEIAIIILFGTFWFDVPIKGSIALLMFSALVFLLVALGFGLFISSVAQNQLQAMQATMLIILPSVLLSGFMFPRSSMPAFISALGSFIPLTYFLEILRGIILKGVGLEVLWKELLILAVFGVAILTLSSLRLRKRLD